MTSDQHAEAGVTPDPAVFGAYDGDSWPSSIGPTTDAAAPVTPPTDTTEADKRPGADEDGFGGDNTDMLGFGRGSVHPNRHRFDWHDDHSDQAIVLYPLHEIDV